MAILPFVLLAAAAIQAPDRNDLERIFRAMDRNGDGYVSASEEPQVGYVRGNTGRVSVRISGSWVGRYDANGDTRVSRHEFMARAQAEFMARAQAELAAYRR